MGFPCTPSELCPTCRVMTTNPTQSITFIVRIFKHLIEAATLLAVDADLIKEWSTVLAHMPNFTAGGVTAPFPVGVACANPNTTACPPGAQSCPASSGPHCTDFPCVLGPFIGLFSDTVCLCLQARTASKVIARGWLSVLQ